MLNQCLLFAQIDPKEIQAIQEAARNTSPKLFGTDLTYVLGIVLALAGILFFWAFFIRKRPKQVRGALVLQRADKHARENHGASGRRKRRKRRPDHPDNWGRNPTLGETGGLPPPRPEGPEVPPSAPQSPSAS
jgi:hypothetical protein